jgi:hypothetical protein
MPILVCFPPFEIYSGSLRLRRVVKYINTNYLYISVNRYAKRKTSLRSVSYVSVLVMRKPSRHFVFNHVNDMAALVEECIEDEDSLIELE